MQDRGPKDLLRLMIRASAKESISELESVKKMKKRSEYSNSSSPSSKITVHDMAEKCKSFFFGGEDESHGRGGEGAGASSKQIWPVTCGGPDLTRYWPEFIFGNSVVPRVDLLMPLLCFVVMLIAGKRRDYEPTD
ncbi:hypothetical protein U1Q18_028564 [Sarracenia purpurea var. burkii]